MFLRKVFRSQLIAIALCATMAAGIVCAAKEPSPGAKHAADMAAGLQLFRDDVRGVLMRRCLDCHGGEETESDFDLSTRDALLRGGAEGEVIEAGNAKESRLVRLIKHEVAPEMPYEEAKLSDAEIASIVKWIDLGAPYDKPLKGADAEETPWTKRRIDPSAKSYWAFQPLREVVPPQTKNPTWPRNAIDRFVLAKLEEKQIAPNRPAEPRVLVRRLYFDLIGLPPTPEQVNAFLRACGVDPAKPASADAAIRIPQSAIENLVDELLASPHYGERWGRHWLDVARFAESHGFEQDYDRPYAYYFRDFVIKALNQDLPYDQFVRWQIAGDEIAPDDPLAMMATGFLGAGVFPTQLTEKEFESARYDELDDMVSTLGTAMLGLTVGCARCHDHKYDPIPQADYYRLVSTFTTTIRSEIELDLSTPEKRAAAKREYEQRLAKATAKREHFEKEQLPAKFAEFVAGFDGDGAKSSPWTVLEITNANSANGTKFEKQVDGSLLVVGPPPAKDTYSFTANVDEENITAVRIEALSHASLPRGGPGLAGNGNFCLSDFSILGKSAGSNGQGAKVKIVAARVTHEQNQGDLSAKASFDDDVAKTGWAVDAGGIGKDQAAVFIFEKPIKYEHPTDTRPTDGAVGTDLDFQLRFDHPNTKHAIGRVRISITTADPRQVAIRDGEGGIPSAIAKTLKRLRANEEVSDGDRQKALRWFAATLPEYQQLQAAVEKLRAAGPAVGNAKKVKVMVCSEGFPKLKHHADGRGFKHFYPKSYFLKRGDPNQKQGEAPAGYLQVLMRGDDDPLASGDPSASSERKLPEKASPAPDPVALSQHWKVDPPEGWRTSYRRRSLASWITDTDRGAGQLLARVIVNRVWQHHFGRGLVATPNDFGVQGERPSHPELLDWLASDFIEHGWKLKRLHRQILLSSTYLQSAAFDAAKAKVDPDNRLLWRDTPRRLEAEAIRDSMLAVSGQLDPTMFGPGTLDEGMKRRSIYFFIKRSKLIPMMQLFDQPEPLVSQGARPATTIGPQALMFMNNPHVRGYARALAGRLPADSKADSDEAFAEAVRRGYLIALSRPPSDEELRDNLAFLRGQAESYAAENKADAQQLALTDFCQVLFSLNEFVFVE